MPKVWISSENNADLQTIQGLGVEVVSLLTEGATLPEAIKITQKMYADDLLILKSYSGFVVLDLVGEEWNDLYTKNLVVDVLVIHTYDIELYLNRQLDSYQEIQHVAKHLLSNSIKSVLILGKHAPNSSWRHDYWSDGSSSFWLTKARSIESKYKETRTVLSAALIASLAHGYSLKDAIIIAEMYVNQAVRLGHDGLYYGNFPENENDLPYLSSAPLYHAPKPFPRCQRLGLYPVVDSPYWVELLLNLGVKTIQLRIKKRTKSLETDILDSIVLAKKYRATLFINDYWELALEFKAQAVHLGQSDLDNADIEAIRKNGLLLGVSTHCYYEVARAHAISPSYIAIGPIFPTNSKQMPFSPQGITHLHRWQRTLKYPLVAIGGINLECINDVVATGVQGVALISAITEAKDPRKVTKELLGFMSRRF